MRETLHRLPMDEPHVEQTTENNNERTATWQESFVETLAEWLVSVSQWFNDWDITILVPALIILTVIAGVTGRAATGPRLWMQLAWEW